jgi:formate dehydrogenase (NADP+) beta subunit
VLAGLDFLRDVNQEKTVAIGKKVVVLGGGNVTFDCARVARRLGAETVHVACLESRQEMPASADEIEQGIEEGIAVHPAHSSTQIIVREGRICGVEFVDVASFSFDEEKHLQLETVENSQHIIEADSVIMAIGQRPVIPAGFGLDTGPGNLIQVDSYSFAASREGVFAAGDSVSGTSTLVKAMASGRKAAIALDRFLCGDGNIDRKLAPTQDLPVCLGPGESFALLARQKEEYAAAQDRLHNFNSLVRDMPSEAVECESGRCLQCDLRLKIKAVKFWGNY